MAALMFKFFNQDPLQFVVVKNFASLERTLGQLIGVFSDGNAVLAETMRRVFGFVDDTHRYLLT